MVPAASCGQDAPQAGVMLVRVAEIRGLQLRGGEIGLLPKRAAGPQSGEIGSPEQGALNGASLPIRFGEGGMAKPSLTQTAPPPHAAEEIAINPVKIAQPQAREVSLAVRQGLAQPLPGGGQAPARKASEARCEGVELLPTGGEELLLRLAKEGKQVSVDDVVIDERSFRPSLHHTGNGEELEVLGDQGLAEPGFLHNSGHVQGPIVQGQEHSKAVAFREDLEVVRQGVHQGGVHGQTKSFKQH